MTEESSQAPTGATAASPRPAARDKLPYPGWLLAGLGALTGAVWLGVLQLDAVGRPLGGAPAWAWPAARALVVLAPLALVLFALRSRRLPAPRRHPHAYLMLMSLLTLAAATLELFPFTPAAGAAGLFLRTPALALGMAIAAGDPLVNERRGDASLALLAGGGYSAVALVAVIIGLVGEWPQQCVPVANVMLPCDLVRMTAVVFAFGLAALLALIALFASWLGYVIGAWVARADRWW